MTVLLRSSLSMLAFLSCVVSTGAAQAQSARDESAAGFIAAAYAANDTITKRQADAILRELQMIRKLLEAQRSPAIAPAAQEPPPASIEIGGDANALGSRAAPVAVVEFTDYQCPYCAAFHAQTFSQLKANYIDTGKVLFVSRDLPLSMHPDALKAAEAARCAGDQGKFWDMRNVLISNASDLSQTAILGYARTLTLDSDRFRSCLESDKHAGEIQKDLTYATALQIQGTPTFIVGTLVNGHVTGKLVSGAQPYAAFDGLIKQLLQTSRQ